MLNFDISDHPTTRVLTLSGHLDALQTLRLEQIIEEARQGTCRHVILNLLRRPGKEPVATSSSIFPSWPA